jgi:hypothetical protein
MYNTTILVDAESTNPPTVTTGSDDTRKIACPRQEWPDAKAARRSTNATNLGFWLGGAAVGTGGCFLGSWVPYTHPVAVASSAFWWGLYFGCFGASIGALLGDWIKRILNIPYKPSSGAVGTSGASVAHDGRRVSPQDDDGAGAAGKVATSRPVAKWPRYVPVPPAAEIIEVNRG